MPPTTSAWIVTATAIVLASSCASTSRSPGRDAAPSATPQSTPEVPQVHRFANNWGNGYGCVPRGEELSVHGTLIVRPFGKGTDGAVIQTDNVTWVVSYRAEGALLELRGKRVVARGRACDKQGQAIAGEHFDLSTLAESQLSP